MWSSKNIDRLVVLILMLGIAIVVVQARLLELQVFQHGDFKDKAFQQHLKPQDIPAKRGLIFDRNGIAKKFRTLRDASSTIWN
jgi:cell division protein FtsI/penicillin-binding protein 2